MPNRNGDEFPYDKGMAALEAKVWNICECGSDISTNASCQFDKYYQPPTLLPEIIVTAGSPVKPKGFGMSFVQAAVRGRVELECQGCNPQQELTDYLNGNLDVGEVNPIEWQGVSATCHIVLSVLGWYWLFSITRCNILCWPELPKIISLSKVHQLLKSWHSLVEGIPTTKLTANCQLKFLRHYKSWRAATRMV